jgi:hypothetical protein
VPIEPVCALASSTFCTLIAVPKSLRRTLTAAVCDTDVTSRLSGFMSR